MLNKTLVQLDTDLDGIVAESYVASPPDTLYHYTKMEGAKGILRSRSIWATRHDCTNDVAELRTADSAVVDIAQDLHRRGSDRRTQELLAYILRDYDRFKASRFLPAYLACFSTVRDSPAQWWYGDQGRGLCIGFRVLRDEAPPDHPALGWSLVRVDYDEQSVRQRIAQAFTKILKASTDAFPNQMPLEAKTLALTALYRVAAIANATTKAATWADECEWRYLALQKRGVPFTPLVRETPAGKAFYYPLPIRRDDLLPQVDEVVIGPNCAATPSAVGEELASALGVDPAGIRVVRSGLQHGVYEQRTGPSPKSAGRAQSPPQRAR